MWNKKEMSQLDASWLGYLWSWPLTLNFQGQMVSWEWDFMAKSGICYIAAKNGAIATTQKANILIER